jgi:hypothetical protein
MLGLVYFAASLTPVVTRGQNVANEQKRTAVALRVDPLLIAEANEVWGLIGSPNNPIWPGWDASDTPLLFYLPGEQDVLINHPHPPSGFVAYDGPVQFPGWRILVKNGPTLITQDGQNTAKDVAGAQTLAVADTLSNMRNQIAGMLLDARPPQEKVQALHAMDLATDPYEQLAMVTHEAFHVFQGKKAPDKGADEMLLLYYPVLSVQNNVGFAQEGWALAKALRAKNDAEFRSAAVRWLAVRKDRRASLPEKAVEYEDGAEFNEGLAMYTQYRLYQVIEGRQPGPPMTWAQAFVGYGDLAPRRERLIERMVQHMSGAILVNNDPYGTAPLRMRLYYSGMAAGVMLDRLFPEWKSQIFLADSSLTSLAEEALKVSPAELDRALQEARSEPSHAALVEDKTNLAKDGKAHAEATVKEIETGPGVGLIVDYSQLDSPKLGMSFTPFGITVVDSERTIFSQVPVSVAFGPAGSVVQTVATPLLRDTGRRLVRFRLPPSAVRGEVEKALNAQGTGGGTVDNLTLELPGASVKAAKAQVRWSGEDLIIVLVKGGKGK